MTKTPDIGNLLEAYVKARIKHTQATHASEIVAWQEIADARRDLLFDAINRVTCVGGCKSISVSWPQSVRVGGTNISELENAIRPDISSDVPTDAPTLVYRDLADRSREVDKMLALSMGYRGNEPDNGPTNS